MANYPLVNHLRCCRRYLHHISNLGYCIYNLYCHMNHKLQNQTDFYMKRICERLFVHKVRL